jgi:hypothetical protein
MMDSDAQYHRCGHCKGFYETEFALCKWCQYKSPMKDAAGKAKVFPDRATCRAIQIAEFEQLPPEAHDDPFQPPPENLTLTCACIHCGQNSHAFEAVEMRWIVNENMWACPCTTCGGRGFQFDIHPIERQWQCAECDHWYAPPDGNFKASNAKCPKCGSPHANGWFDDEADQEELAEEFAEDSANSDEKDAEPSTEITADQLPWTEDPNGGELPPGAQHVTEHPEEERMPDDIDFPRKGIPRDPDGGADADSDIPF